MILRVSTGSPEGGAVSPPNEKLKLLETLDEKRLVTLTVLVARLPEQLSWLCTF